LTTDEHGTGAGEGTSAAARLLEMATRNADELLGQARAEAASIVAAAQIDADRLTESSQAQAERVSASARAEVDRVLAAARAEAARLGQLELECRNRMRSCLTEQLAQIEPGPDPELRRTPSVGLSEQRAGL
jgi:cell division septum initiation protein DivIVA